MEQQTNVRTITLRELGDIFLHRLWIMILAALVVMGGMFLIIRLTFVPEYASTATLYILRQNESAATGGSSSDDFSLALKVVNDCDYILKSHSVLDEVIDELHLDIAYEALSKSVSTSNPEDTRILEVTVVSDTPENARLIVDSICRIGTGKIEEAMGFSQVNLYEYGILNPKPCNTTGLMTYALTGVITAILVYTIFLIAYLVDDRIRTDEDIEQYLGLSVLGEIPNLDEAKKYRSDYYSYGSPRSNALGKRGK